MHQFIIVSLMTAMDAKQIHRSLQLGTDSSDSLALSDVNEITNPYPSIQAHAADAVNSLMDNVLNSLQPVIQKKIAQGIEPDSDRSSVSFLKKGRAWEKTSSGHGIEKGFLSIDVSPVFDISAKMDAPNSFHDNDGAASDSGEVARVQGALVDADFANSMYNNNNAIAQGDVQRLNGVGVSEETSTDQVNDALQAIGAMGTAPSSLFAKPRNPLMLGQSKESRTVGAMGATSSMLRTSIDDLAMGQNASQTANSLSKASDGLIVPSAPERSSQTLRMGTNISEPANSVDSFMAINVKPWFRIVAAVNFTGSFYNNNNAASHSGPVQRVNGALVDANFSGSLHDNNKAQSFNGSVKRVNGVTVGPV